MGNFFKKMGGFLVILLPFMVAFVIILWFIAISKFFIGEKITDPLDIDRRAANLFEQEQEGKRGKTPANDAGKFAGATINIYSNKTLDEEF